MPETARWATAWAQSPWTEPTISNCGNLGDALVDALADLVVDEHAGEAADLEQIAALGQLLGQVESLVLAHVAKSTPMR